MSNDMVLRDMVTGRVWREGRLIAEDVALDDLSELLETDGVLVWFDVCCPTPQILERLRLELGLDPLAIEDAIGPAERPKAGLHGRNTFVSVYATDLEDPDPEDARRPTLAIHRVSAFVLPRGVVTVRLDEGLDIDQVVERWEDNRELLPSGPPALVHGLLDVIVDGHFVTIQQLDDRIEAIEDQLFDESIGQRALQEAVFGLRKDLVQLRRVILPMREVMNAIIRHDVPRTENPALAAWFQDLEDHVLRAAEWTESLRDMISTIFETNLSLADARMNSIMKKLAAWAAIIAVPTLITGWFGQNLPYPGFDNQLGLWLSVGLCFGAPALLFLIFKRYDWV